MSIRVGDRRDAESLKKDYLILLASEANALPLASLDANYADPNRGATLGLVDVYTALDTTEIEKPMQSEDQVRAYLKRQEETRRISAQEMINTHPRLVLLGDPGSGKSTIVNYLAHLLAYAGLGESPAPWLERIQNTGPWDHGALFPVRVILRELVPGLEKGARGADLLLGFLKESLDNAALGDFWDHFHQELIRSETPCLILLDGLDEVPAGARRAAVKCISDFAVKYPANRYVATCRIYAYVGKNYQLDGFKSATLTAFNEEQIDHFIDAWYGELAACGRFTRTDAESRAQRLKHVSKRRDLQGLSNRPLLLTVMALLHTFRGQLPEDRVELYQWAVDLLLRRWEERVGGEDGLIEAMDMPGLRMSDLEAALYDVAFQVHAGHNIEEESADVPEAALRQTLACYLNDDWNKAGAFIKYIQERAGLLVRHKPEAYTFPHRTFQEFMAACHLAGMKDYPSKAARLAAADPDRWRIVFILAAGHAARTHRLGLAISSVNALCPADVNRKNQKAAAFLSAEIAGEALIEIGLIGVQRDPAGKAVLDRVRNWLLAGMQADRALKAKQRADAGNVLARVGDPRFDPKKFFLPKEKNMGFVKIPAGKFLMGSDQQKDKDALGSETPQHAVTLSEYWISRYPVTVAQFRAFVEDSGFAPGDEDCLKGMPNHPVVWVSWHEAMAYCKWLTRKLKGRFIISLPTEAQWEKAARGTDGGIYPWGNQAIHPEMANYDDTGLGGTSPAGCFASGASPYDLLDMSGNVWEWTKSVWGKKFNEPDFKYPYEPDDGREDEESSASRVLRGGSWCLPARGCRAAYRLRRAPSDRDRSIGFRLCLLPGHQDEQGGAGKSSRE